MFILGSYRCSKLSPLTSTTDRLPPQHRLRYKLYVSTKKQKFYLVKHIWMLTAVDFIATSVIVNKHFLNVTYRTFKDPW